MAEYRIVFTIERAAGDDSDFTEVGFGSSGGWSCIEHALHDLDTIIGTGHWETEGDMPAPDSLDLTPGGSR